MSAEAHDWGKYHVRHAVLCAGRPTGHALADAAEQIAQAHEAKHTDDGDRWAAGMRVMAADLDRDYPGRADARIAREQAEKRRIDDAGRQGRIIGTLQLMIEGSRRATKDELRRVLALVRGEEGVA